MVYIIVFLILLLLGGVLYFYISGREARKIKRLKQRYILLSHMPPDVAEESLNLHIENLKRKFPGRSMEWYLEKIIYDLERDRS
jgi:hypothetical protein